MHNCVRCHEAFRNVPLYNSGTAKQIIASVNIKARSLFLWSVTLVSLLNKQGYLGCIAVMFTVR